jgi:hypothetical protein
MADSIQVLREWLSTGPVWYPWGLCRATSSRDIHDCADATLNCLTVSFGDLKQAVLDETWREGYLDWLGLAWFFSGTPIRHWLSVDSGTLFMADNLGAANV